MRRTTERYLVGILAAFVLLDLALTCWQNYQFPLDGDLPAIVWPAPWYSQVLHDPFGWTVLTKHAVYGATNRFFVHATMVGYWKTVPLLLQRLHLTSPISSLYAASALFTTAVQAALIGLLALAIRRAIGEPRGHWGFWLAAALLTPLFQTDGFNEQMGVTNRAVTYTFFYGLAMVWLLVLLWPFYQAACQQQKLRVSPVQVLLLVGLMVVVAFNGPIATASAAVLLLGIGVQWLWERLQLARGGTTPGAVTAWLSGSAMALLAVLGLLCLYSIYVGRSNSENTHDHTLRQLYELVPMGIYYQLTWQRGLLVLLALLLLNWGLVRWAVPASAGRSRVLLALRWVAFFSVTYVLLLPLGGYRSYRPYLLRNDSILPVLLAFIFAYGLSAYFLLLQLPGRLRNSYLTLALLAGAYFTYADRRLVMPVDNGCERWSLDQLARAKEPTVRLSPYCPVLAWNPVPEPGQSEWSAELLHYWHITDTKRLYYQK